MTLPRSQVELQNQWTAWFEARTQAEGLDEAARSTLRSSLAQEISWMMVTPDLEANLNKRLAKMAALRLAAKDGDLTAFDPFWRDRLALLSWFLT